MAVLEPLDIITGPPQSTSVDDTRLTDNSYVLDWYTYFYAPDVTLSQNHSISVLAILSGQPVVSTAGLIQNYNIAANSVEASPPIVSTTDLVEDYSLTVIGFSTEQPVVSPASMTEAENLAANGITTGVPVNSNAALSQSYTLVASSIVTRRPEVEAAVDPNAIIAQEIEEIQQMFGGWNRRIYEVPDGRLVQAEREIQSTFGDTVSIDKKAKSLLKFGKSAELSADTIETVWSYGGNEVYVQDNLIDSIVSSNVVDNQEIYLECHTVEGTGADQKFTFMTQAVTLNGQTRVPLPTPVARVSKAYNNNGTELVGSVYVYQETPLTNGVPQDRTKVHAHIPQGFQQSFKGATTFSNEDYYILTGGFGSVSNKQAASVDFYLEVRTPDKVFRQGAAVSAGSAGGSWDIDLDPCIIIPKNADIRITCETATQGAVVFGSFKGYLAKVTS